MSIFKFVVIHILIGISLKYFNGKLPKALVTFGIVFLGMSIIYFGTVLLRTI